MFRLSTISVSITFPLIVLNSIVVVAIFLNREAGVNTEENFHLLFSIINYIGASLSTFVISSTILFGYLLDLTIKQSLLVTLISEIVVLLSIFLSTKDSKNNV